MFAGHEKRVARLNRASYAPYAKQEKTLGGERCQRMVEITLAARQLLALAEGPGTLSAQKLNYLSSLKSHLPSA